MLDARPWLSASEALTSILIPFPLLLATLAFSPHSSETQTSISNKPISSHSIRPVVDDAPLSHPIDVLYPSPGFVEACAFTSVTLLLMGILAKICPLDRRKDGLGVSDHEGRRPATIVSAAGAERMLRRALSVGLPLYAGLKLGGDRAAMVLLTVLTGSLSKSASISRDLTGWKKLLSTRKYTFCVLILGIACDVLGYTMSVEPTSIILGHLALFVSTVFLPLPIPRSASSPSQISPPAHSSLSTSTIPSPWHQPLHMPGAASALVSTKQHIDLTLATGALLFVVSVVGYSFSFNANLETSSLHWVLFLVAAGAAAAMLTLSQPSSLQTDGKAGFVLGLFFTSALSIVSLGESWVQGASQALLGILSYLALQIDTSSLSSSSSHSHKHHQHQHHNHHQGAATGPHRHGSRNYSTATDSLLRMTQHWPLARSILIEKDSRRIFYFMV